uniref:Uncharacterized protein n=1 Tax=Timema cristinae TaxID=61476 RepID=A0A7R9CZV5_TIMCR|nr:unnamed protein product [Timema cristinae]
MLESSQSVPTTAARCRQLVSISMMIVTIISARTIAGTGVRGVGRDKEKRTHTDLTQTAYRHTPLFNRLRPYSSPKRIYYSFQSPRDCTSARVSNDYEEEVTWASPSQISPVVQGEISLEVIPLIGSTGDRTRNLGPEVSKSDHYTTEAVGYQLLTYFVALGTQKFINSNAHNEDDEDEVFLSFDNTVEMYAPSPDESGEDGDISSAPDDTAPVVDVRQKIDHTTRGRGQPTKVRDEEGLAGLKEMRSRYSASVISSGRAALIDSATSDGMFPSPSSSDIPASPEDSNKAEEGPADPLDVAISQLISNLPQAAAEDTNDITSPLPDIQYVKVVHFSKSMPPPHLQAAKAGVYAPTPRYEKRMPGLDSPESVPPISPAPSTPDSVSTASSGSQDRPTVITERPSVFSVNPMARPSAKSVCVPARTESVCVKSSGATTTVLKRAGSSADCDRISPVPKRLHTSYRNRKREQASSSSQVETEQSVWPKMSPEQQHRVIMSRSISPPETGGNSYSPRHSDSSQVCVLLRSTSPSETGQSYSTRCSSSPQGSVLLRSISPSETGQSYSTRHPSSPQGSVLLRSISPSGIGPSYTTRHPSSPQGSVLLRSISPSETGKSYSTIYPSSPHGSVMLKVNQTIVHSPAPSSPLTYPDFSGGSHPLSPFHMMGGPDLLGYQSTAVLSPHTDSNSFSSLGMVDTDSTAPTDLIDMLAVNTDALRSGFVLDVSDDLIGSPVSNISGIAGQGEMSVTLAEKLAPMKQNSCDLLRAHYVNTFWFCATDHIYGDSSEPLCPPESLDQVTGSFSSMEEQFKTHEQDSQITTMVQHVPLGSQVFGANITQLRGQFYLYYTSSPIVTHSYTLSDHYHGPTRVSGEPGVWGQHHTTQGQFYLYYTSSPIVTHSYTLSDHYHGPTRVSGEPGVWGQHHTTQGQFYLYYTSSPIVTHSYTLSDHYHGPTRVSGEPGVWGQHHTTQGQFYLYYTSSPIVTHSYTLSDHYHGPTRVSGEPGVWGQHHTTQGQFYLYYTSSPIVTHSYTLSDHYHGPTRVSGEPGVWGQHHTTQGQFYLYYTSSPIVTHSYTLSDHYHGPTRVSGEPGVWGQHHTTQGQFYLYYTSSPIVTHSYTLSDHYHGPTRVSGDPGVWGQM